MKKKIEKWTAYGARNWEGGLAGGLPRWNRPSAHAGIREEVGNKNPVIRCIQKLVFVVSQYWYQFALPSSARPPFSWVRPRLAEVTDLKNIKSD